jgi:two-component system copper resistance phosphate regulon response regulator CusR
MPKDTKTTSKGKKILIVEDERPLAHALELKMTHEGYDVHVSGNGDEGLKEATTGKYDLILLDLIMPGVDGFAILKELQNKKSHTKVIVLSNLGQDEDRKKAAELGAKDYLVKANVPLSDIVKVVKSAL